MANAERDRLADTGAGWKRWGPYLSERAWGTVREDYSADGEAWDAFRESISRQLDDDAATAACELAGSRPS